MAERSSWLEIRGGPTVNDLMRWPDPSDPNEVEWRLRHGRYIFNAEPREGDVLTAASYMNAYRALIDMPQKTRNARIEQIKTAMNNAEREGGTQ